MTEVVMERQQQVTVTRWSATNGPTQAQIEQLLAAEGLSAYQWSNGPGDRYSPHTHAYDKVIYVVRGSITFGLPDSAGAVPLEAGDRLDLPAGTRHDAVVGPHGVICLEAHR
jgi:quercetin dioxygenase-like cupin family protein